MSILKIACFGDFHAHIYKEFDHKSDRSGSKRLDLQIDTLEFIKNECLRREIDTILFSGDAFHVRARVNTLVFNSVYDKFKEIAESGIRIIAIPGNHDDHDNSDLPQHSLHAFKDIDGVEIMDKLSITMLDDRTPVVCVRYSKNTKMIKDFINSINHTGFDKKPILLGHMGISGGFVGKGSYPMPDAFTVEDLRPDVFKYVVLGHFHRRQTLGGYDHVLYTGAPIQHSFSDEGEEKGFIVLDTKKRWDIQFVPIPNPMFLTMSATDVANEDMQKIADEGHYVRIYVKEKDLEYVKTFIPDNLQYKIILEKSYEEQTRIDVKIGMSEEEVVKKYAEKHNPEALEMGLKILEEVKNNG